MENFHSIALNAWLRLAVFAARLAVSAARLAVSAARLAPRLALLLRSRSPYAACTFGFYFF